MSALRISRAALRVRSAVAIKPVQRRGYADAVSDKIKLSLALPHQVSLDTQMELARSTRRHTESLTTSVSAVYLHLHRCVRSTTFLAPRNIIARPSRLELTLRIQRTS
jgi:hypothetical protein